MKCDRGFVERMLQTCLDRGLEVYVFGGWAEELLGLAEPREHTDLDLLIRSDDLAEMDRVIGSIPDWREIVGKRFPHKRAVEFLGIMVEFTMVLKDENGFYTDFFHRLRHDWPEDLFSGGIPIPGTRARTAGISAVRGYRERHTSIEEAASAYREEMGNIIS